ncbi:16S rRNA (adenine(1518)-N(6)/adenine(1519)-N(6))-dimethyltransferase RsmA [Piscinibacter sakaiensis]|uniref:Ribosomal RNA small subunit methyltransferase A n=1 Tax=Piscinibacter sakaiensis TaxID=1547922 RepID=A0A0K8P6G4_PISS1|nr:16S rRNA (adenine(1518)-N(6)/adenine(1519)-N(6))-dimethyltransferase RsmA [Piscinibacter sakaiensis]GAP38293.1 dimethyladenosine transferase [Piscinibacter sakaiensis]
MAHIPRKRFGQHFLADEGVVAAIVAAIDPRPGEALVEIGPGLGAMTGPLVERCGRLTVIELDRDLAARLRRRPGLEVVEADVLTVDFRALAEAAGRPLRVVGNLPYNISTPILFHLLAAADRVADQTFMLQKEVVERMAAAPGGKDYGRLSVMLQWRYAVESLFEVPPEAFDPPPRVDSAIVRMDPLPAAQVAGIDAQRLGELVGVAFSQRRKLLRHTLGRWLEAQGAAGDFDLQRRAEEVPVSEYLALARRVGPAAG